MISIDFTWIDMVYGPVQDLDFPLIADEDRQIAQLLGMLVPWRGRHQRCFHASFL